MTVDEALDVLTAPRCDEDKCSTCDSYRDSLYGYVQPSDGTIEAAAAVIRRACGTDE